MQEQNDFLKDQQDFLKELQKSKLDSKMPHPASKYLHYSTKPPMKPFLKPVVDYRKCFLFDLNQRETDFF